MCICALRQTVGKIGPSRSHCYFPNDVICSCFLLVLTQTHLENEKWNQINNLSSISPMSTCHEGGVALFSPALKLIG
jgi:hypothetical protein